MARLSIDNGEARVTHRTKINDNFTEVYANIDAQTIVSVTGAVTLDATAFGKIHVCTGTSADYNLTLLTAAGHTGQCIAIKGAEALTKIVTVVCNGAETIDGYTTRKIGRHGLFVLMSDGTNWVMVNEVGSLIPWVPTYGGYSADPVMITEFFRVGRLVTIAPGLTTNGTSSTTAATMTLPFNSAISINLPCLVVNAGTTTAGRVSLVAGSNVMTFYTSAAGGAFTASGLKSGQPNFTYTI